MLNKYRMIACAALTAACALFPAQVRSQETAPVKSDLLFRVGGPVTVAPTDTIGTLWVIGNSATVLGTVRDLVVINGTAKIDGTVQGNMVIVSGTGDLGPSAVIGKDILLYHSTVTSGAGAKIGGAVHNEVGVSFGARALWVLWLSVTIAMIAAGIVLGYFAGDALNDVADSMRTEWRGTIVTALILIFGLPFAAVISFMTGIGFVLGFFILFALIPLLCLTGYVIAGTSLGTAFLNGGPESRGKMYSRIAFGILMLQLLAVVPALGGVLILIGSQLGAGALVYRAWRRGRNATMHPSLIVQPA